MKRLDEQGLRAKAERIIHHGEAGVSLRTPQELQELVHELRVHQIELEMQNQELCRSQQQLEGARSRYFTLFDQAPVGYFIHDRYGMILEANQKLADLLGLEVKDLRNTSFARFSHPDDRNSFILHLRRSKGAERTRSDEVALSRSDGQKIWVVLDSVPMTGSGDRTSLCTSVTDITRRKEAEDAAGKMTDLLNETQNIIHLAGWEYDVVRDWTTYTDQIYTLLDIAKKPFQSLLNISRRFQREDTVRFNSSWQRCLDEGEAFDLQLRYPSRKGPLKWIRVLGRPVLHEDRIVKICGLFADITEAKQVEQDILNYQAKLQGLTQKLALTEERERQHLAEYLHDQLGQGLAFAKMKLQMITRNTSEECREGLNQVCDNLTQLIEEIRSMTFALCSPLLTELGLERTLQAWLQDEITAKHGIKTRFEEEGPHIFLDKDMRSMLFRCVRELLTNAVKHGSPDRITVRVQRDKEWMSIVVQDDGVGFDLQDQKKQSSRIMGFGLFSIHERLRDVNGSLTLKSSPEQGCRAELKTPILGNNILK